jgi:hypothetical protein
MVTCWGPPSIINGEDPKEYFELWERFHAEAKPRDLTETALYVMLSTTFGRSAACVG